MTTSTPNLKDCVNTKESSITRPNEDLVEKELDQQHDELDSK